MKIVMIGEKAIPYPAGIDRYIEAVGKRLVEKGHQVTIFVRPHYMTHRNTNWLGMELIALPSIRTKNLDAITHVALSTLYSLKLKPDVIHFHMIGSSPFCLLARLWGLKTVLHVHGLDYQRAKWGPGAKFYLKLSNFLSVYLPNKTITISKALKKFYKHTFQRETVFIPAGIDLPDIVEPKEILKFGLLKGNYILFLSRLVPEKGCHYLIKAFKRIKTHMNLVIAGSSTYDSEYVESLKRNQDPRIKFLGEVSLEILRELYSNAYLFVQPSEIEGFPQTILEALSYGRCVLASNIEGNKEALENCGYLFESRNIDNLSSQIALLIEHPEFIKNEFEKARNYIEKNYNWGKVIAELENLYSNL
jgi:glycosyltransferase involved in cell wall biosynthesis